MDCVMCGSTEVEYKTKQLCRKCYDNERTKNQPWLNVICRCGVNFKTQNPRTIFCSTICGARRDRSVKQLDCVVCGNPFDAVRSTAEVCGQACGAVKKRTRAGKGQRGFVYAIAGDYGLVKLGSTRRPQNRLEHLQTGSPIELKIIASVEVERMNVAERILHSTFSDKRIRGEWFDITHEEAIAALYKKEDDHGKQF